MIPALSLATINSMYEEQKRLILGELALSLGEGGVEKIAKFYKVQNSYVEKAKRDYANGIRYHRDK